MYLKAEVWTRYGYPDEAYCVELHRLEPSQTKETMHLLDITWPPE